MFPGTMDVSAPLAAPGDPFANVRTWPARVLAFTQSERFGNTVIVLFFLAQAMDGGLTYIGVSVLGRDVEGNPLLHWLMGAITAENVTAGIASAALVAYLSGLCNTAFTATQYALFSSLMANGRTVMSTGSGWLIDNLGNN